MKTRFLALLALCCMTTGCVFLVDKALPLGHSICYSREKRAGCYVSDCSYELQDDVFLKATEDEESEHSGSLVPPRSLTDDLPRLEDAPDSIQDWHGEREGDSIRRSIVAVIKKGTKIKYLYMRRDRLYTVWFGYIENEYLLGKIQNGEYAGWIVELSDVSRWGGPHSKILKWL